MLCVSVVVDQPRCSTGEWNIIKGWVYDRAMDRARCTERIS